MAKSAPLKNRAALSTPSRAVELKRTLVPRRRSHVRTASALAARDLAELMLRLVAELRAETRFDPRAKLSTLASVGGIPAISTFRRVRTGREN